MCKKLGIGTSWLSSACLRDARDLGHQLSAFTCSYSGVPAAGCSEFGRSPVFFSSQHGSLPWSGLRWVGSWLLDVGDLSRVTVTVNGSIVLTCGCSWPSRWLPLGFVSTQAGYRLASWASFSGYLPSFHLLVIDRVFLWLGRLDRLR